MATALPWEGRLSAAPSAVCVVIASLAVYLSLAVVPSNVDVSWLLSVGDRVLSGERLYVDIAEGNPPFSTWLYMPFLVLERLTGLAAEIWVSVGLAGLAMGSVWFSARILVRADESLRKFVWTVPVAVFAVLFLFPLDFGQREQIAVIAILPWLALLSARDGTAPFQAGKMSERLVAGVGAAVFVMIKPPYSALALAVPALTIAFHRRSLQPLLTTENFVGGFLTLAYLVILVVFHQPFFADVLPLLRQAYLPIRMPVADMLTLWPVTMFAAMAAATLAMAHPRPLHRDAKILLLAAAAYVPAFFIMGKGWTYHALPFLTLGALALILQGIRLEPWRKLSLLAKIGVGLGLLLAVQLAARHILAFERSRSDLDQTVAAIQRSVDRPTIFSIGSRLQTGNPLTRMTGARSVARHPSSWMIDNAGILIAAERDLEERRKLETLRETYTAEIARELASKRPDIVVDAGLTYPQAGVPLRNNPAIAKVLAGYRLLHQNALVTVLVRSDIAIPARRD